MSNQSQRKNRGLCTSVFSLLICLSVHAQTFSSRSIPLYDYLNTFYIQEIPVEVSGVPEKMNEVFGIEGIQITVHHPRSSDLKIQLQSPDGTTVWVTNRNGGLTGSNYINTRFSQFGKNGLVNNAKNPFTGNYIPDGQMTYLNNGSNPNGTWKLLIEDLKEGEEGFLDSVSLSFGKHPAILKQKEYCGFNKPQLCECNRQSKSCELLPDLVIVPRFTKTQYMEFGYNDPIYPGQLKVAVAIANIGLGPLEVLPDTLLNANCCAGDTSIHDEKRYRLIQKVYSKTGNTFNSKNITTGTIYFEKKPGHQHYHVDDWIEMRLVKYDNGKRVVACKGSKVSYCLFTTGMLYEKDSSSLINGKFYGSGMSNYGLGEYYACSLMKQGITVGGYDYYGPMYEGQYLQLPKGLKNGEYWLEIEIDPEHKYVEGDKKNNIFRMKINITKQEL